MKTSTFLIMTLALAATLAVPARAADPFPGLLELQEQWATAKYQTTRDEQGKAFEALEQAADDMIRVNPGRAEPLIWKAIILSTQAGVVGGFSALDKVKGARDLLFAAEKIDPQALDGSIYTSLGSLYYQVPGWPIGFGDDKKAGSYLQKALALNPDGIDPNYFYADYLFEQKKFGEAATYARKALDAPARSERPIADEGRRAEAAALLARLQQDLARN